MVLPLASGRHQRADIVCRALPYSRYPDTGAYHIGIALTRGLFLPSGVRHLQLLLLAGCNLCATGWLGVVCVTRRADNATAIVEATGDVYAIPLELWENNEVMPACLAYVWLVRLQNVSLR